MPATPHTFEACLPLTRLYARFDAIAGGLTPGDSTAAHRAVIDRLASNRRTAEDVGWTACTLERQGGSGRLLLRGVRSAGLAREVVPDWIPRQPETVAFESSVVAQSPDERKQERYRHLEILIRERLLATSPPMTTAAFDRLARRLVAAAYKHAAPSSSGSSSDGASVADLASTATEPGPEARWLDDGGA